MRILLALLLIALASFRANAQETLFSDNVEIGIYVAPEIKFTSNMDGDFDIMLGGKGALVFNKKLGIGLGGWVITPNADFIYDNLTINSNNRRNFGYGGLYFEYIDDSAGLIHFNVNCLFGAGVANLSEYINEENKNAYYKNYSTESFGIIEPGIQLEVNFYPWMKVALGGSYRIVYEYSDFLGYEKSDFEGFAGVLTFKFGFNF